MDEKTKKLRRRYELPLWAIWPTGILFFSAFIYIGLSPHLRQDQSLGLFCLWLGIGGDALCAGHFIYWMYLIHRGEMATAFIRSSAEQIKRDASESLERAHTAAAKLEREKGEKT